MSHPTYNGRPILLDDIVTVEQDGRTYTGTVEKILVEDSVLTLSILGDGESFRQIHAPAADVTDHQPKLTVADKLREGALKRVDNEQERRRLVVELARLHPRERVGQVIPLNEDEDVPVDEGTFVVEIINSISNDATVYGIVNNGSNAHRRFLKLDEALLFAVQVRNGGSTNEMAFLYAARVLNVPEV